MENTVNTDTLPEVDLPTTAEATTPAAFESDPFLEIKFNKELIKLDRETAVTLAQKGMKYDSIKEDYEKLKSLEGIHPDDQRLFEEFPELSSFEMLPEEVKTASNNNNTGLLLEYLLYLHRQTKAAAAEAENQSFTAAATTGPLSANDREDPAAEEFLRGVWGN